MINEVPDKEVREEIVHNFETNYLIDAGAGSGKTTILVERIANLIKQRKTSIQRIAAITYTRNSTANLILKIREKLEEYYLLEEDDKSRQAIEEALEYINYAHISTIHSFCYRIVLEHPYELGIDPFSTELDEYEKEKIITELWNNFWLNKLENADEHIFLLRTYIKDTSKSLLEFSNVVLQYRDLNLVYDKEYKFYEDIEKIYLDIRKEILSLTELFEKCKNPDDKCYINYFDEVYPLFENKIENKIEIIEILLGLKLQTNIGAKNNYSPSETIEIVKKTYKRNIDIINEWKKNFNSYLYSLCCEIAIDFVKLFSVEKRKLAKLDFEDLLINAKTLLKNHNHRIVQTRASQTG